MPSSLLGVVPHDNYLLSYNGYTFDPATTYTEYLNSRPDLDAAKRTVKFVRTRLAVVTKVFQPPPTTVDAVMESIKQKLMSQGGELYYRDKGFGNFNINVAGGRQRDVSWGPVPTHLDAKPTADAYVWEVRWGCEVCIPWCDAAKFENAVMEWVYQVFYDYDEGKYETRRIQGSIEIPLTRQSQGDRLIRATADDYREQISPAVPPFFRPGPTYFNLSEDRRRLTFGFHFHQMPGPVPPPGVLKVRMPTSLANDSAMNFCKWTWTLRGEYELVYGTPHIVAARHFIQTAYFLQNAIKEEIRAGGLIRPDEKANHGAGEGGGTGGFLRGATTGMAESVRQGVISGMRDVFGIRDKRPADELKGLVILPVHWSVENPDHFDRSRVNFNLIHTIVGTIRCLLMAGQWTALPGDNDWVRWRQAAGNVFGPRGSANSHFAPSDDVIIDLCRTNTNRLQTPFNNRLLTREIPTPAGPIPVTIDPEANWVELKNQLKVEQHDSVLVHKPLPEDRTLTSRGGGSSTLRTPALGGQSSRGGPFDSFIPPEDRRANGNRPWTMPDGLELASTILRACAGTYTVIMTGHALRVGMPGDPPDLVSVGGMPAVAANNPDMGDGVDVVTVGNVTVPVFLTAWQLRYVLPAAPGTRPKDASTLSPITPSIGSTPNAPSDPNLTSILRSGAGAGALFGGLRRF